MAINTHEAAAFDALAAKVDELVQVCTRLSRENAELRDRMSRLPATAADRPPAQDEPAAENGITAERGIAASRISRRTIGKALAGAAAAGVVGAAALADLGALPAAAADRRAAADDAPAASEAPDVPDATSGAQSVINASMTSTVGVVAASNTGSGPGVSAKSKTGRGAILAGAAAQLQLTPSGSSHPKSGKQGDLYADTAGRLWFCKKTGTSATWKQIA